LTWFDLEQLLYQSFIFFSQSHILIQSNHLMNPLDYFLKPLEPILIPQNCLELLYHSRDFLALIFYNGLFLEGKLAEILDQIPERAIAVTRVLSESDLLPSGDEEGAIDPHVWFDASLWAKIVRGIGNDLSAFDPQNASSYQQRAAAYAAQLDQLHLESDSLMSVIPAEHRILITAHDAFGYFGRAYDIEVRGLQGISTVSEYGIRDVSSLVTFVTERRVPAIFIESGIPPRSIESVIAGARQRGHRIIEGGMLYSDSLGGADELGSTYIGMMRHNVTTIVNALSQQP
jgi:manganese/zinc/iron transport system substrate-binding protein